MIDPEHQRRMNLAARMFQPWGEISKLIERVPRFRAPSLFDHTADIAEQLRRLPGGLNPRRRRQYEVMMEFAWALNDRVVQLREREDITRRLVPAYARALLEARLRGEVPVPVEGVHVAVGFRFNARAATRAAFIVVPWRARYEQFSFAALAGLSIEILATAVDLPEVDLLALELELQGARRVQFRRIDGDYPAVLLHDAGHSFVYRLWSRRANG